MCLKVTPALSFNLLKSLAILVWVWLLPGLANAQVTGVWDTTTLSRLDITAIRAPGLVPSYSVEIADGNYQFNASGSFVAGDVTGTWKQTRKQYKVRVNRFGLENQFRQLLESKGMAVQQIKLVKAKFEGLQMDNGVWGIESYEYQTTISLNAQKLVLRVVLTVNVAGKRPLATSKPKALAISGQYRVLDKAAATIFNLFKGMDR